MAAEESHKIWTVRDVLAFSESYLAGKGLPNSRRESQWLMAELLGYNRLDLYLNLDKPMKPGERDVMRQALKRRASGEPLAYILGVQPFRGLAVRVDPAVLIPRPETELLPDILWRHCPPGELRLADIGTGSGCLALALAVEAPKAQVTATDLSPAALALARVNLDHHGVGSRADLREGDLCQALSPGERFDAIVSNPPYVALDDCLEASVRDYEPHLALYAGSKGMDCILRLLEQVPDHLAPGGWFIFEFGLPQEAMVREGLAASALQMVEIVKDLAGLPRFAVARLP